MNRWKGRLLAPGDGSAATLSQPVKIVWPGTPYVLNAAPSIHLAVVEEEGEVAVGPLGGAKVEDKIADVGELQVAAGAGSHLRRKLLLHMTPGQMAEEGGLMTCNKAGTELAAVGIVVSRLGNGRRSCHIDVANVVVDH